MTLNTITDEKALFIIKTLKDNGYEAYLVGGCVRDFLLNKPIDDIDITTSAKPEEVKQLFNKTIEVGVSFGVIIVVLNGEQYEVATFRTDGEYLDGRRPSTVSYASAKEDVQRRDFTINGLLYDPIEQKVLDYVDGQKDLETKQIKAIGNPYHRFTEDKLRMIRAIRFTIRFHFTLEENTKKAIQSMAHEITAVSNERITQEFEKLFKYPNAYHALTLMKETKLLHHILPHFQYYSETAFSTVLSLLKHLTHKDFDAVLAVLLNDVNASEAIETFEFPKEYALTSYEKKLRQNKSFILTVQNIKNINNIYQCLAQFKNYHRLRLAEQRRILLKSQIQPALKLQKYLEETTQPTITFANLWQQDALSLKHKEIPTAFLDGNELQNLGLPKGQYLGEAKEELENQQLEDKITTKDQAIHFIKTKFLSKNS